MPAVLIASATLVVSAGVPLYVSFRLKMGFAILRQSLLVLSLGEGRDPVSGSRISVRFLIRQATRFPHPYIRVRDLSVSKGQRARIKLRKRRRLPFEAMAAPASVVITETLLKASSGDRKSAERLLELLYDRLRSLARNYLRRESPGHSMQATELVHEAFLKLVDQSRVDWRGESHFYAVGAIAMRRILTDHARAKKRYKRGGEVLKVTLHDDVALAPNRGEDVLAVEAVLQELEKLNKRHARIVEMRFFGGLTVEQVAEALDLSKDTVKRDWRICKAWIRQRLRTTEAE